MDAPELRPYSSASHNRRFRDAGPVWLVPNFFFGLALRRQRATADSRPEQCQALKGVLKSGMDSRDRCQPICHSLQREGLCQSTSWGRYGLGVFTVLILCGTCKSNNNTCACNSHQLTSILAVFAEAPVTIFHYPTPTSRPDGRIRRR